MLPLILRARSYPPVNCFFTCSGYIVGCCLWGAAEDKWSFNCYLRPIKIRFLGDNSIFFTLVDLWSWLRSSW